MLKKSGPISKTNLHHLSELVRIKLTTVETNKYLKDLKKIIDYFEDLKKVNTDGVAPMNGGTSLSNIFREDSVDIDKRSQSVDITGRIIESFPDSERGYLKVPKIL